jgi:hypothetical protein
MGPLKASPERVFRGEFLDAAELEELRNSLIADQDASTEPAENMECANDLAIIISAIKQNPPRPSDQELCKRYCDGRIAARTVMHITGWNMIQLYDTCVSYDLNVPDIRS